jgi:hypothetical protein
MATAHKQTAPALQDLSDPASFASQVFRRLTPPKGEFNPDGQWRHRYHDSSSHGLKRQQGELTIERQNNGQLRIENYRDCSQGYRSHTLATLQCGADVLATPTAWEVETKVAKAPRDKAHLGSGLVKRARVTDGVLTLAAGRSRRTMALPGAYTCKWCLLAGVGRMAEQGMAEITFTLLDEYDEPLFEQRIAYHGEAEASMRDGMIHLRMYQHTGTGTVPGIYYVDDAGRVLAYLAGMQLLVLGEANGESTGYMA